MVLVLSGPVHGGKTTLLRGRVPLWTARGLSCGGFLSVAAADGDGYDLLALGDGSRRPFLRRQGAPGAERTGPFAFVPESLDLARSLIRGAGPGGLLVVDEVGPLELRGRGLWPALRETVGRPGMKILMVAREDVLEGLAAALAPVAPLVLDVRDPGVPGRIDERLFESSRTDDRHG